MIESSFSKFFLLEFFKLKKKLKSNLFLYFTFSPGTPKQYKRIFGFRPEEVIIDFSRPFKGPYLKGNSFRGDYTPLIREN